jgi:DNA-binding CsgD family transcriptional regulator
MLNEGILDDLIGRIYDAAVGHGDWETVLDHLSQLLDGRRIAVHRFCSTRRPPVPAESGDDQPPTPSPLPKLPAWSVFIDGVPLPEAAGAWMDFHADFLQPQGLDSSLCLVRADRQDPAVAVAIWRPRHGSGWGAAQARFLRHVAPHLGRALDIERRLAAAEAQRVAASLSQAAATLTRREKDCLALVARGASNKETARRLGLSVYTVEDHVKSLIRKLQASSRTEAVATALGLGLLIG